MTKTIYSLTPVQRGDYATDILKMIENHNGEKAIISLSYITGWLNCEWARLVIIRDEPTYKFDPENGILEVYEGGKLTFTIHEKIVNVLDTVLTDNEKQGE